MRLLQPSQVSGEIMNLLDKARGHVVIVSPYNKIKNWFKLAPYLQRLRARGLPVEYYVRKEPLPATGLHEVREAGFTPIEIEGLHCKFYLNEAYGIVTSMNLLLSSDVNALEIGYVTETAREYEDLVHFLEENIRSRIPAAPANALTRLPNTPGLAPNPGERPTVILSEVEPLVSQAALAPLTVFASPTVAVIDESVVACWSRLLRVPLLANQPYALRSDLSEVLSLHVEVRHSYVLAAYTFRRDVRQRLYKALYARRQEIEARVGYPVQWGKDLLRVKLHLEVPVFPPVTAWDQPKHVCVTEWSQQERERLGEQVQRATHVLQQVVPEVLYAVPA